MRYKFLRKYANAGPVQDVNQQAMATSQPQSGMPSVFASPQRFFQWELGGQNNIGVPRTSVPESYNFLQPGAITPTTGMDSFNSDLQQFAQGVNPLGLQGNTGGTTAADISPASTGAVQPDTTTGGADSSVTRSQDGNPLNPMIQPYFATDLNSRAASIGRSIGRAGTFGALRENAETSGQRTAAGIGQGANIAQGILSGISFALGAGREIASAASEERARMKDIASYRQKMRQDQLKQFETYAGGGAVNIGGGKVFNTSDLTGEYIQPLPKSMEDEANVEIEKGEYVLRPDVVAPQEALGEKHSNGGTKVDLPEAYIISDYREMGDKLAERLRRDYGILAKPGGTYASALDKFKKKIGLKEKYEEQEKILARLEKIEKDTKDENTKKLNKSIVAKYLAENQAEVNELETSFRQFADLIYAAQEAKKHQDSVDELFRDGGPIDKKKFRQSLKASGMDENEAKEIVWQLYNDELLKMSGGGPTDDEATAFRNLYNQLYGRNARFNIVDVAGIGDILNEGTGVTDEQGLQHINGVGYGRASTTQAIDNLLDVNRWGRQYYNNGDFDTRGFQTGYNAQTSMVDALNRAGLFSNADDARNFYTNYSFRGEPGAGTSDSATNSKSVDDKFGQWTASRSFYSLDVLTPEEKKRLNDAGIRNFSDLWADEEKAKAALNDEDSWNRLSQLHNAAGFGDMDFVLDAYTPAAASEQAPRRSTADPSQITSPVGLVGEEPEEGEWQVPEEREIPGDTTQATRSSYGSSGMAFPEVLRAASSGIAFPGMLRAPQARIDPVLASPDAYMAETSRQMQAQLDALGEVPGQQRAAILANLNAVTANATQNYINQVDYRNAQATAAARQYNEESRVTARTQDNVYRNQYENDVLKAVSLADENYARYLDSVNDEVQQKWNAVTSANMIRSVAPNIRMLPNGQMVYVGGEPVEAGAWSNAWIARNNADSATTKSGGGRVSMFGRRRNHPH